MFENITDNKMARDCIAAFDRFIRWPTDKILKDFEAIDYVTPMDLNKDKHVNSPLKDIMKDDGDRRIHAFIKELFRWSAANPNKSVAYHRVVDSYELPSPDDFLSQTEEYDYANRVIQSADSNTRSITRFRFDDVVESSNHIALIGSRGSGKTAFINYWLTISHRYFEATNRTWFRFDVTKVNNLRDGWTTTGPSEEADVINVYKNYFRAHTFFVLLAYGTILEREIQDRLGCQKKSIVLQNLVYKIKQLDQFGCFKKLAEAYTNVMKNVICTTRKHKQEDLSEQIVAEFAKYVEMTRVEAGRSGGAFDMTCAMGLLRRAIAESETDVFVIFDGIDNIDWTKENSFYMISCHSFDRIWRECLSDIGGVARLILAIREETLSEITLAARQNFNHTITKNIAKMHLKAPKLSKIISKKLDSGLTSEGFKENRDQLISAGLTAKLQSAVSRLKKEAYQYEKILQDNFNETLAPLEEKYPGLKIHRGENFTHILFDYDVRAALDTYVKVNNLRHFYIEERSRGALDPERQVQYVFLNARAFFHTELDTIKVRNCGRKMVDRGAVFPNLFWYKYQANIVNPHHWHGLATIRLICVGMMRERLYLHDLIIFLIEIFGYTKEVVLEIVEAMVAFSIIDIEPLNNTGTGASIQRIKKYEDLYKYRNVTYVTEKGRMYYYYILSRPDILYLFALDTPLLATFVRYDTKYVRFARHYDDLNIDNDFMSAAITTLAIFMQHVNDRSKKEIDFIRGLGRKSNKFNIIKSFVGRGERSIEVLLKAIEIPNYTIVRIHEYIRSALSGSLGAEISTRRYDEIFGIINKDEARGFWEMEQ